MLHLKLPVKIFGIIFVFLVTTVCSAIPGLNQSRSTEIAASIFLTMTAEVTPTSSPTITPSITPSMTPTITPRATNTFTPTPVPPSEWPLVISDSFDSNEHSWPMLPIEDDYIETDWTLMNGKYQWEALAVKDVHYYVLPNMKSVSDFYLSTELQRISGPVDCTFGVVFRARDDDNFYMFGISETQNFSIYRKYKGDWETLVDWRYSATIRQEDVNRITIVAQGSHFVFWINDQRVIGIDDDKIAKGRNGLTMTLYNPGDQAVFEFDNFEVREP